jgi:hypothetical protein
MTDTKLFENIIAAASPYRYRQGFGRGIPLLPYIGHGLMTKYPSCVSIAP